MKNIKLIIAYEGTAYLGWQKTKMGNSIEEVLEKALFQILGEKISLQAASRTDAGVHAEGQVVNFLTEKSTLNLEKLRYSLSSTLPQDIEVLSCEEAEKEFHPTLHAIGKEYHYFVCMGAYQLPFYRHFSWHYPKSLDLDDMQNSAKKLHGRHDFSAFCNERPLYKRDPICNLQELKILSLERNRLQFVLKGDRFLYKMVRNLVGTLLYIGCNKLQVSQIEEILEGKLRKNAGMTAPAHGLILKKVFYS